MYNTAEKTPSILSGGNYDHFAKIIVRHCGTVWGDYFEKISSIFNGSPDTGHQFVYLLYIIWSRNAWAIKRAQNTFAALRKNGQQTPFCTGIKSTWKSCWSQTFKENTYSTRACWICLLQVTNSEGVRETSGKQPTHGAEFRNRP